MFTHPLRHRGRFVGLFCLSFAALSATAAPAVRAPFDMLDARVNAKAAYAHAMAARGASAAPGFERGKNQAARGAAAFKGLKHVQPGLDVHFSNLTGAPTAVTNRSGTLTAASSRSSEQIAHDYLAANPNLFGLSAADLADLHSLGDSAGSGLRMLRMEQRIDGRAVFQSETRFLIDHQGRLVKVVGQLVPQARASVSAYNPDALLAPAAAAAALTASIGAPVDASAFAAGPVDGDGRLALTSASGNVSGPVDVRPVLFPLAPGVLVPAWSLVLFTPGNANWYAVVDAETGDVLWRKNIRDDASAQDARFRVYVQADGVTPADSPAPQSPTTAAPGAGTQYAEIAPTIVSMHTAMDAGASQNGWIDDCPGGVCTANESQTLGNNVVACMDQVQGGNANICDTAAATVLDGNGRPTGNPDANSRDRDFLGTTPRDFQTNFLPAPQGGNPEAGQTSTGNGNNGTLAIDQYRRGAVTQLFYVVNWYHDQLFNLGFDEAAGNFQLTNFSGMGLGNDRVNADSADGSGVDNANFSTPPDGTGGRMQMYRFTGPTIDRDGSLDAEIMMHELTHGTSNRLVGNGAGLNWDPARGMGEGWSDFVAMSLLNNTNADDPNGEYASGAWATYKLGGLAYLDNYVYGIRRFPYSTDINVNPMTWADVDDVTNDLSGGIAPTPVTFNLNGAMEVHNAGEVWAETLWDVRGRVIADPDGANGDVPSGNRTMLKIVIDGLKMTPINPTFIDARDAILDADCANNGCANENSIWGGFAHRGLGFGAEAPYAVLGRYVRSHEGIHESFALPALYVADVATDVSVDDSATNGNGVIDPGEAVRLNLTLTNPWRGAGKAVTAGSATLTSATPGVTIYTGTATLGAIAAQGTGTTQSPVLIAVDPSIPCGSAIDFTLTTTTDLGTTTSDFSLRVGQANGVDPVVTYTGDPNPDLVVSDNRPRGVFHQINITDDFVIADVDLRIDSVTTPGAGDLTVLLRAPDGVGADVVALIDGLNDLGGTSITNMVIDDDAANDSTTDMVQATTADAPYTKSWQPVYNSPWAALVNPTIPSDTVGQLTRLDGRRTKGTWSFLVADVFSAAAGGAAGNSSLNSWSILVTPVHFDCSAVAPATAISATKTVSGNFVVGGTVTYTVTLTNDGSGAQGDNPGHEFVDVLPAGLSLVSANATSGTASTSGNEVDWDGSLAPLGGSVTISIDATIDAGTATSTISNQGTANVDTDNDGSNDGTVSTDDPGVAGTADPTTFVVGGAVLSATKTVAGSFSAGGNVTYTVVIGNGGNSAAADVPGDEFTDVLPAELTLVSASATSGTAVATVGTNTVTWNGSVPAGGDVVVTINATIGAAVAIGTTVSNQGSVNYDSDLDGSSDTSIATDDPGTATATDPTNFVVGGASLSLTKAVTGSFTVGGSVTYTLVIDNGGNSASLDNPGDELTDVLPAQLTLVSASASAGTAVANVGTNTVTWNGSVPAAGSVTVTIAATVNPSAAGQQVANQATLDYDANLDGTNDRSVLSDDPGTKAFGDPTVFTAAGTADVSVSKTVAGTFGEGGAVTYTLVLSNSGNAAAGDNAGDELTDVLPGGLTLVSASATSGTASANVATRTVTWNGAIPAGGSVTLTIAATIDVGTAQTTLSNQASVNYDSNADGSNDTTVLSDDPSQPGATDPTVLSVAAPFNPVAVPLFSPAGLALLLLGLAAAPLLRRRVLR